LTSSGFAGGLNDAIMAFISSGDTWFHQQPIQYQLHIPAIESPVLLACLVQWVSYCESWRGGPGACTGGVKDGRFVDVAGADETRCRNKLDLPQLERW
jgi:hypothetical protein